MLITTTPYMVGASYREVVLDQIASADSLKFAIAFIQKSGIHLLQDEIKRCIEDRNGEAKLICSFDFGITDPAAIQELKDMGVEIKLYSPKQGAFHPKLWLFQSEQKCSCLIGSANFSYGALESNVEIGVLLESNTTPEPVKQALGFFEHLWSDKNTQYADETTLDLWQRSNAVRTQIIKEANQVMNTQSLSSSDKGYDLVIAFVKEWIDSGLTSIRQNFREPRLWRGWYIIPDQGYVNDELVSRLAAICSKISDEADGKLNVSNQSDNPVLNEILSLTDQGHVRERRTMNPRDLFIRQEKNYLINLNFAYHPFRQSGKKDKNTLILTEYGQELGAQKDNLSRMKSVYTTAFEECYSHGLNLLEFTWAVLDKLQYIEFKEFSYFINHIFSQKELNIAVSMVQIYRAMPAGLRERFDAEYNEYFSEKLEPTASDVQMNYEKHVKHTMSALGWCSGLVFDSESLTLRIEPLPSY